MPRERIMVVCHRFRTTLTDGEFEEFVENLTGEFDTHLISQTEGVEFVSIEEIDGVDVNDKTG